MFSSTYNGEFEDVKAVHDGVGEFQTLPAHCTAACKSVSIQGSVQEDTVEPSL
jgi:hypothetical protein